MLNKTLALHYHIPVSYKNGVPNFPFYFGEWVDQLTQHFRKVIIFAYYQEHKNNFYELRSTNIEIICLGAKPTTFMRSLASVPRLVRIIKDNTRSFDFICLRVPTFLAIYCVPFIGLRKVILIFVGNMYKMIDTADVSKLKKYVLKLYWGIDALILSIIGRFSMSFILGPQFIKEYRFLNNAHVTFTSTIKDKDVLGQKKVNDTSVFTVTFLGRISPEKGLKFALRAIATLKNKNIKLKIIGGTDGSEFESLSRQVEKLQIKDIVEFTGLITNKNDIYVHLDDSDVLLLPSIWDGQTRAIWEGMARGLPVIASRGIGAVFKQFDHLSDVYFIDPGSSGQIRDAIVNLKEDNEMFNRLSESSLRIARQKTIESSIDQFVQTIKLEE